MSSISSVSSTIDPYQATNQSAFVQFVNDFNAIGNALQSGNLSSAQSALAAFQQDLPGSSQSPSKQPFGNNSQANTDYQGLTSALQSGDLSGAQKAFTNLQNDLEGGGKAKRQIYRANGGADSTQQATSTATTSTSPEDVESLLDALA
jgi:hypothetical protein